MDRRVAYHHACLVAPSSPSLLNKYWRTKFIVKVHPCSTFVQTSQFSIQLTENFLWPCNSLLEWYCLYLWTRRSNEQVAHLMESNNCCPWTFAFGRFWKGKAGRRRVSHLALDETRKHKHLHLRGLSMRSEFLYGSSRPVQQQLLCGSTTAFYVIPMAKVRETIKENCQRCYWGFEFNSFLTRRRAQNNVKQF